LLAFEVQDLDPVAYMATVKPEHVSYHSNPSYTDKQDQDDLT
jgi:hypothetical protein